ncbi:MAG: HAD-IIB family hydrolase, partial [Gammaproteobacteria bacterium]|nr:HAD-IIB family hydrolase [Gammaproteobacteria bacterium]
MTKLLLCTDLDRTLIPNGPQAESALARKRFAELTARDEVSLVYVTGRDKSLVMQAIKNYNLPIPDFVIADVGSTIYHIDNGHWDYVEQWDTEISGDWKGKSNTDLQVLLKNYRDIRVQEHSKQKAHKLSYYVPLYVDQVALLNEIKSCFKNEKIDANLIWSVDEAANIGLLDILPVSANKKHAIEFLMGLYNFSLDETIFAGDSGNDISVMVSPIRSVLVANASDEVKQEALEQANLQSES